MAEDLTRVSDKKFNSRRSKGLIKLLSTIKNIKSIKI